MKTFCSRQLRLTAVIRKSAEVIGYGEESAFVKVNKIS